jgi:hypothetical protein
VRLQLSLVPVSRRTASGIGPFLAVVAGLLAATLIPSAGAAEDRVSVRGVYFREASTRVVEPMVMVSKDLPEGYDAGAHFLLDAVTSASVAAGADQDAIFTEWRKEAGLGVGRTFAGRTRIGAFFRYSDEPDYKSRAGGVSLTRAVWENTGTLAFSVAAGHDLVGSNIDVPPLRTFFAGVGYTQALSPVWIAQVGYEALYLNGTLENIYLYNGNWGPEQPPRERLRHAIATRIARYFPEATAGVQLHYRLYVDQQPRFGFTPLGVAADMGTGLLRYGPERLADRDELWGLAAHTVEARVYKGLVRDVEVRVSYRFHQQRAANFWCNTVVTPACYGEGTALSLYRADDLKFGPITTHAPELKVIWDMRALAATPVLGFFAPGTLDVSFAYYLQDTRYGDARLLQLGYTLAF